MELASGGWFETDVTAPPGADYGFSLDGGPPRPDPRSAWQPYGVDGPSRTLGHMAFEWSDSAWTGHPLAGSVVYELHVGTFSPEGTFDGALGLLPHLTALGVTAVEVMPVAAFPGERGWGYDGVCVWAPHESYGGPDGFKRFVDACHNHGLAVVLDVVYNHMGPVGNYLGDFGPYFTDRYSTPWGEAVNFDGPGSDEVREFFISNAEMWLTDYHIDGLRLDAVHAIFDASALHFVEELTQRVDVLSGHLARSFFVVVESDLNDPRFMQPREAGGYGASAGWNDDFHHALHTVLTGDRHGYYVDYGSMEHLAHALRHAYVYDGRYSRFRDRRYGRAIGALDGNRFVAYLQNHDQVGNRAHGERSWHLTSPGRVRVGAALVLTAPFIPLLFQGQEWGAATPFLYFTDHGDPALAAAVSEGRRREFDIAGSPDVPDPQDPVTFERSRLDWSELEKPEHAELLEWYRQLISIRRDHSCLTDGRLDEVEVRFDDDGGWLVMERGPVTVACNLSADVVSLPLESASPVEMLACSDPGSRLASGWIVLAPDSVVVLRR